MSIEVTKRRVTVTRWDCNKFTKSYASTRGLAKALILDRYQQDGKPYVSENVANWYMAVTLVAEAIATENPKLIELALVVVAESGLVKNRKVDPYTNNEEVYL